MSRLLDEAAVGSRQGEDAQELMQEYIKTTPAMAFSRTLGIGQSKEPDGKGAGDHLIKPR